MNYTVILGRPDFGNFNVKVEIMCQIKVDISEEGFCYNQKLYKSYLMLSSPACYT